MYWCDVSECIHPKTKNSQCYKQPSGEKCEHAIFGCPKCHSKNIFQQKPDCYFLVCSDCGYKEFDD